MPRPLKSNLLRDGYESAAEHVALSLRHTKGPHLVCVDAAGGVRVKPLCKFQPDDLDAALNAPGCLGAFNRQAQIEHIEDNLLARLRELSAQPESTSRAAS